MREIKLNAADGSGEFSAFVWEPKGKAQAGAVLVIQEIFGVNAHIRDVTERFAKAGYVAIAPPILGASRR